MLLVGLPLQQTYRRQSHGYRIRCVTDDSRCKYLCLFKWTECVVSHTYCLRDNLVSEVCAGRRAVFNRTGATHLLRGGDVWRGAQSGTEDGGRCVIDWSCMCRTRCRRSHTCTLAHTAMDHARRSTSLPMRPRMTRSRNRRSRSDSSAPIGSRCLF